MEILLNVVRELIAPTTAAFALAAIGLNFHFGLTGLLNMGHAGFMLVGMYGYAIVIRDGGSMWMGLLVSLLAAGVFAVILGWPTLRLRGDYLAIVTIAAAEMIRYLGRSQKLSWLSGGSTGIRGNQFKEPFEQLSPFPDAMVTIGPFVLHGSRSTSWWLLLVAWALVAVFVLIYWRLASSPWGRVLKGVREDEDAVRSLGKNVFSYKMQALVIGGMIGALAGVVWAHANAVQPDSMGRPTTFWIWTLLLLGGAASVFGPALGSVLFWGALVLVRGTASAVLPSSILTPAEVEPFALTLVGITLMLLIIFRPQGILGNKRELSFNG